MQTGIHCVSQHYLYRLIDRTKAFFGDLTSLWTLTSVGGLDGRLVGLSKLGAGKILLIFVLNLEGEGGAED